MCFLFFYLLFFVDFFVFVNAFTTLLVKELLFPKAFKTSIGIAKIIVFDWSEETSLIVEMFLNEVLPENQQVVEQQVKDF